MENIVALLGLLEWLPVNMFTPALFAVATAVTLLSFAVLHKHWSDQYHGLARSAFGALSLGALFEVLASVVLGLYVLLQPLRAVDDNRWLEGARRMDLTRLSVIDPVDNRIVGPTINPVIDNINQQITTVNDVSEVTEQSANMVYGFVHTIEQSEKYLPYFIVGSILLLLFVALLVVSSLGKRRHDMNQVQNLLHRVAALESAATGQPSDPNPNRTAWLNHSQASQYPYTEGIDYGDSAQVRDFLSVMSLRGSV